MGPSRRSRIANKNYSRFVDEGYYVDPKAVKKGKHKKRKLSDMLISHWSKVELERFYEAYRRYGREWKKVAAQVLSKTPHEAEVLFNMFKAYLSLPEGGASAVGLIALMKDRCNAMEEGNSDPDSKQVGATSENSRKRSRVKSHIESSKGSEEHMMFQNQLMQPDSSCLSILRRSSSCDVFGGNQSRAVRKRTPRFPVSSFVERNTMENVSSPMEQYSTSTPENSTEKGIHIAALALARASQMVNLPDSSVTLDKKSEQLVEYCESKGELKLNGGPSDACAVDVEPQSVAAGEYNQLDNRVYNGTDNQRKVDELQNGPESLGISNYHCDDLGEAYGRSEGADMTGGKTKMEREVTEEATPLGEHTELSGPVPIFSADEESALDALQALSGLEPGNEPSKKNSELGSCFSAGENTQSEANVKVYTSTRRAKRKKWIPVEETNLKSGKEKEMLTNEVLVEEANKTCTCQHFPLTDQGKIIQRLRLASSSTDVVRTTENSAALAKTALVSDNHDMPISRRKKHKLDLQKEMSWRSSKSIHMLGFEPDRSHSRSLKTGLSDMKGKLSNCLSSWMLRRWCTFEWFYSSIDYPWFARLDFVEYLNHVKLGHVPRLTQVEWSIIRSSLGKPRRLSQKYLLEERKKLEHYRDSVRTHYAELRAGVREGIAMDLAKPLAVGQRVIARHPKTREICDGNVLTVDQNRYRVQFDKTELGVEFVMDTDCMSSNPWENLPDDLRRQHALNRLCNSFADKKSEGYIFELNNNHLYAGSGKNTLFTGPSKQSVLAKIQEGEDDINARYKLSQAYKRKEALEMELRQMKEEASLKQKGGIVESDQFRKQYAMVLLQLREASLQFGSALLDLGTFSAYNVYNRSESHVVEIVETSRHRAKSMVDEAMKAMCSLELGKGVPSCPEVAASGHQDFKADPCKTEMRPFQHSRAANSGTEDETTLCVRDTATSRKPIYGIKASEDDEDMGQTLSELISASVATLLMVQACTERQYPPADVAEILDCAVVRLQPRCSKNLPLYREIESCIGLIKSQMLALIPTRSSSNFPAEVSV